MGEIAELERRITAALARVGAGLEQMVPAGAAATADSDQLAALREELAEERTVNAQLSERLRAVKERDAQTLTDLQSRLDSTVRQLDAQGLEAQRLRKSTIQLREALRKLREAQTAGLAEPHLINKAMLAELEALRAVRASESAEMDEILAELTPRLQEVAADA